MILYLTMLEDDRDQQFFLALVEAYEKKIFRIALSILKEQTLAEDAVQNAWINAICAIETLKALPWEETEAYLVTIVKNTAKDLLKKERRTDPFPEEWEIPDPKAGAATGFQALVDLIRAMPVQYREILELKFVLEWSNKAIAARLGMNESTVSSRIERGRELLKKVLREEGACYE